MSKRISISEENKNTIIPTTVTKLKDEPKEVTPNDLKKLLEKFNSKS